MTADRCSFCLKARKEVRALIASTTSAAMICDRCCFAAKSDQPSLAYCASCPAPNGKHDPACPEREIA